MSEKTLTVITGPTASGKTDLAVQLALERNCPVISADSRQVYKELNIGVARPSEEQLKSVKHYLIAHRSIHENYNAGVYAQEARTLINALFREHDHLIVCGGTGLYIKALLKGLDPLPGKDDELRQVLTALWQESGIGALQEKLRNIDPERFAAIDHQNPHRLIRAIEIACGQPVPNDIPAFEHNFRTEVRIIETERAALYERINKRVELMIAAGLEAEARDLYPFRELKALQTVGYTEWWPLFEGHCSLKDVTERIRQHTRNYAKRQLTWFRNQQIW